jgi:hypothetical protein
MEVRKYLTSETMHIVNEGRYLTPLALQIGSEKRATTSRNAVFGIQTQKERSGDQRECPTPFRTPALPISNCPASRYFLSHDHAKIDLTETRAGISKL